MTEILSTPAPYTSADAYSEETLREQVANLTNHITTLQSNYDSMSKNWEFQRDVATRFRNQVKQFEEALKENVADESIDMEIAKGYADIFDITLTKRYDVSVTVTFSGTVEVPIDMDESDIQNEVSFSFDEGYSDLKWDIDEDGVEWDIQEAY